MPLRLEIKKELSARSDRVKSVDIFPAENPWVLAALYSGNVYIWDYSNNTMIKSFETGTNPVRCAKFIVRKQWIIAGTDDMMLRVYNYNTMDKVRQWEAHTDYIRFIEIHPNRPYILTSSDDMTIKLWDWEKNFDCIQVFEGHAHYVMQVRINPRDTNTFASCSLDKSIKVWGLTAGTPHFSLDGPNSHEKGVNCLDYYPGGDKPFLLSGADDKTVKIWDYQTKACLQTLEGHAHNISSVCFHPRLPLILSASEDGTVRLWHSTTYRPETTLNYGLERAWCIATSKDSNKIAVGYDEGTIVLKLGNEKPVASLDTNTGKLVWAKAHDIQTMNMKGFNKDGDLVDGERLVVPARDLGSCEVYPQTVVHNSNGSFIVVCGDGEYIIYTSQALRNKAFGNALDFVWSALGTGDYAIRESSSRVRTFKNFKDHKNVQLPMSTADGIFGGQCLGVKGADAIVFFDWDEVTFIRKIDVAPNFIFWSESGDSLVLACDDSFYVLHYDRDVVAAALSGGPGAINPEEGVEGSFELVYTINDNVRTGQWVGECFLYTNASGKMNYIVGGEVMTLCHLDHPMYLLGFVPKEDRVFLIDKSYNIFSYRLLTSVLSYQTAVVRQDFVAANNLLPSIPKSEYPAVARFLESQGFKEEALAVTTDLDQKFELAVDLRKLEVAHAVLLETVCETASGEKIPPADGKKAAAVDLDSTDVQSKWRRLGDLALSYGDISLAETCAVRSADLSGLLLLYSSSGNKAGMQSLAVQARDAGRLNVSFISYFLTGQLEEAIELLIEANRIPEAAFMARTYMPSQITRVLNLWKADLKNVNEKAAEALADPEKYANLFPDLDIALMVEQMYLKNRSQHIPASRYPTAKGDLDLDLIAMVKGHKAAAAAAEEKELEDAAIAMSLDDKSATPAGSAPASPEKASTAVEDTEDVTPADAAASAPASPAKAAAASPAGSPVSSPAKPDSPAKSPAKVATPEKADNEEEDLNALMEEEDALLAATENSPVPKGAAPAAVTQEETEQEEDLDLGDLDDDAAAAPAVTADAADADTAAAADDDNFSGEDW